MKPQLLALLETAIRRCEDAARSEDALGYAENAATYTEMARDAHRNIWWVLQGCGRVIAVRESPAEALIPPDAENPRMLRM